MGLTVLGRDTATNQVITLDADARSRGVYVIGSTGTGKTTLLQSIAFQDIVAGGGVCLLDPHGDMLDWVLARIPQEREKDVILWDPADEERPFGLNLLYRSPEADAHEIRWIVSTIMSTIRRLYEWTWGPRLEHVLGHTLWTAMTIPESTIVEALLLLTDQNYRRRAVVGIQDRLLKNFWQEFPEKSQKDRLELISSTVNKFTPFLLDPAMRNIVGQTKNTIDLHQIMDEQKILLVNLSKGDLGENNSALLGSVVINLILIAALRRRGMSPEERQAKPFHVIVDEYQNFASDSFSVLQSEARKYAVDLVVAHQFRDQLTEENRGSTLNVGNFVAFRTTGIDGQELALQFDNTPPPPLQRLENVPAETSVPDLLYSSDTYRWVDLPRRPYSDVQVQRGNELTNLPPFQAYVRLIETEEGPSKRRRLNQMVIDNIDPREDVTPPDSMQRLVYGEDRSKTGVQERIKQQSVKNVKTKAEVMAEIAQRTKVFKGLKDPPAPTIPAPFEKGFD